MIHRRAPAIALVACVALPACRFLPLDTLDALNSPGPTIPLRAAYWVPPEFRTMNSQFPIMADPACGTKWTCVDERRVFPNGIAAVARAVFADSHEAPNLDSAFDDATADVVMAPELTAISGQVGKPFLIRILWRVWAKDHSVVWLDTITSNATDNLWSRNNAVNAFNRCVREQFEQAATAMRAGRWWVALAAGK